MMKYLERRPVFVFPSFPGSTLKSNFHLCPNWMSLLNYTEAAFPSHVPSRFHFKTFLATLQKQSSTPDCLLTASDIHDDSKLLETSELIGKEINIGCQTITACALFPCGHVVQQTKGLRNNLRNPPTLRHTLGSQCLQRLACHVAAISSDCDNLIKSNKRVTLTSAFFANFQLVPQFDKGTGTLFLDEPASSKKALDNDEAVFRHHL